MDEQQLTVLWRTQSLDLARLRTTEGQDVDVVYRGRPQRSAGPDFQSAIVVVGGELLHGDVELHVRSSAWVAHGHQRDHRYDRVVLHVVLRADAGFETRTAAGTLVPCLSVEHALPQGDLSLRDDDSACRRRIAGLSDAEVVRRLDSQGDLRLAERAGVIGAEAEANGFEQTLYARLLEALGFSQNRAQARELAGRLVVERLYALAHRRPRSEAALLCRALLFGVAGLLPSQRPLQVPLDWASEREADDLESVWRTYTEEWVGDTLSADQWSFAGRPLNAPTRRLAGLAEILGQHLASGLVTATLEAIRLHDPREAARKLVEFFIVEVADSYWAGYHDFGRPVLGAAPRLVGPERAREIVASVALPLALAWAEECHDDGLAARARAAFAVLPSLAANEATRWMMVEVLGVERRRLVRSARRQQGLYRLFTVACDQRLCDRCPLSLPA